MKTLEYFDTIKEGVTGYLKTVPSFDLAGRSAYGNSNELSLLCEVLSKNKVNNVIEIGTYKGIASALFSSVIDGTVHTININLEELKIANVLWDRLGINNVKSYLGDSLKILPELLQKVDDINFIYVDGQHFLDYPLKEYEIILNNLKFVNNCLIYFDDGATDVQRVVKKYNIGTLEIPAGPDIAVRGFDTIGEFYFDKKIIESSLWYFSKEGKRIYNP